MKQLVNLTDTELVRLYEKGNNKAFEVLLYKYQEKVFNQIYRIVKQRELTEDIFQETFFKAIINLKQGNYVETGKFLPWINRIAHNLIIDHFRRKKNENTVPNYANECDLLDNLDLYEHSIEDNLINEQILSDVVHLIYFLPENQQEVVRMRIFQDLSFKEIAKLTGVSINTALGRMRYALINMRRLAEEHKLTLEMK